MTKWKRNKESMHRITRVDYINTHGWVVRFRYRNNLLCNQLFSDGVYGSKNKSKKEAIKFKDEISLTYSRLEDGRKDRPERYCFAKPTKRNTSGVLGVFRIHKTIKGREFNYFIAQYYNPKYNPIKRYFSIDFYGLKKAFLMACEFREQGTAGVVRR